ncbi:hypothetical protein DPMN_096949 [Dreissena polymorpha]|uniref:Elongation factor EFG domain-containing protein n=2 Tax=Dreissena polymorpha TaxID=45954 RepID=A0A9D4L9C9_DREPO|nr:hypothetical protein DPMN_096949 [Dreissena polymorpha]
MNNLIQRRGEVTEDLVNNDYRILHVLAPLANLVGYSTDLRTMTSGTASFSMELDHYAKLSEEEERKIIQKKTGLL